MQPIEEIGKGKGRTYGPTGFWGRGYVQLTWETNYAKATKRLRELGLIDADVDFVKTPDLVMKPEYALPILFVGMNEGWFTGRKLLAVLQRPRSGRHQRPAHHQRHRQGCRDRRPLPPVRPCAPPR